jgi:hypothetical protein
MPSKWKSQYAKRVRAQEVQDAARFERELAQRGQPICSSFPTTPSERDAVNADRITRGWPPLPFTVADLRSFIREEGPPREHVVLVEIDGEYREVMRAHVRGFREYPPDDRLVLVLAPRETVARRR